MIKTTITAFCFLMIGMSAYSQGIIRSDTAISKVIRVGESFDLQFEQLPGAGYIWELSIGCDSGEVSISQVNNQLIEGNQPKGGKYIATNRYTGLKKGTFLFEYTYGRPWLQEQIYHCNLKIIVKKTGCSLKKGNSQD